jgi:hypothetical protein
MREETAWFARAEEKLCHVNNEIYVDNNSVNNKFRSHWNSISGTSNP